MAIRGWDWVAKMCGDMESIYLELANTLFSHEKTKNALECREWRSVPVSSRDVGVRQNVV